VFVEGYYGFGVCGEGGCVLDGVVHVQLVLDGCFGGFYFVGYIGVVYVKSFVGCEA